MAELTKEYNWVEFWISLYMYYFSMHNTNKRVGDIKRNTQVQNSQEELLAVND
jgi:hypothetical protein